MRVIPSAHDIALSQSWFDIQAARRARTRDSCDFQYFGRQEPTATLHHFLAEIAVEHYGCDVPYERMHERGHAPTGRIDFSVALCTHDVVSVHVTWNWWRPPKGKLYHRLDLPFVTDILVLVVPGPPLRDAFYDLEIVGWTDLATWHNEHRPDTFQSDVLVMDPWLLRPIEELREVLA